MNFSPSQEQAIQKTQKWFNDPSSGQIFRIFGYAGTGKTTISVRIAQLIGKKVLFAAYTGKAALVMSLKGCTGAQTIHSLIYSCVVDEETGEASFILNPESDLANEKLLIVDEVSMVDEQLATDLLSFGVKILVLGDPAQLKPIKGKGYFIKDEPEIMLTEVHRQAENNPIIKMSMEARNGRAITQGNHGKSRVLRKNTTSDAFIDKAITIADQVICGTHKSRVAYNAKIRDAKGLCTGEQHWHPTVGDKLICWKNDHALSIVNGSMWEVVKIKLLDVIFQIELSSLDEKRDNIIVKVPMEFFKETENDLDWRSMIDLQQFKFGWVITCHKAQGSQWNNVVVFDESWAFKKDKNNWLYTAITRAAEILIILR